VKIDEINVDKELKSIVEWMSLFCCY